MMGSMIEIDLWDLLGGGISVALTLVGAFWGVVKWKSVRDEQALDTRFQSMEDARKEGSQRWDARFTGLEQAARADAARWSRLENDIDARLDDHASRLAAAETRLAASPSHEDLSRLYDKVNRVAEESGRMAGELKTIGDTLRLILSQITKRGMP